jgi:hypothetical protein
VERDFNGNNIYDLDITVLKKNVGIQLPFGWDILLVIIGAASGAIWYYSNFENKVNNIDEKLDSAMITIEELVSRHIEEDDKRYEKAQVAMDKMQEEIKWYQKNISINPLSWKKKNKNK